MTAYDKALEFLARREYSSREMEEKLRTKGFSADDSSCTVGRLIEEGLLSDERYAEAFVRARMRRGAEGKAIVMRRLLEKGVDRDIASAVIGASWDEECYIPGLKKEYARLSRKYGKEKAVERLRMKGFAAREIEAVREEGDE